MVWINLMVKLHEKRVEQKKHFYFCKDSSNKNFLAMFFLQAQKQKVPARWRKAHNKGRKVLPARVNVVRRMSNRWVLLVILSVYILPLMQLCLRISAFKLSRSDEWVRVRTKRVQTQVCSEWNSFWWFVCSRITRFIPFNRKVFVDRCWSRSSVPKSPNRKVNE